MTTTSTTQIEEVTQVKAKSQSRLREFFSSLKARLTPPKDEGLIWWLVRVQGTPRRQLAALIGFLLLFKLCTFDWMGAAVMIASMFFHEMGHWILFRMGDIKAVLMLLFPLGAVAAPANKEENRRSDELSWNFLSYLLFAGPAANAVLMVVGHLVKSIGPDPLIQSLGDNLIMINGILGLSNLLPFWKLDAGQYFKLVYSSLDERHDRHMSVGFAIGSFALILLILGIPGFETGLFDGLRVLLAFFGNIGWVIFAFLFAAFNLYSQGKDDPEHCTSPQRITRWQLATSLFCYFLLTAFMLFLV